MFCSAVLLEAIFIANLKRYYSLPSSCPKVCFVSGPACLRLEFPLILMFQAAGIIPKSWPSQAGGLPWVSPTSLPQAPATPLLPKHPLGSDSISHCVSPQAQKSRVEVSQDRYPSCVEDSNKGTSLCMRALPTPPYLWPSLSQAFLLGCHSTGLTIPWSSFWLKQERSQKCVRLTMDWTKDWGIIYIWHTATLLFSSGYTRWTFPDRAVLEVARGIYSLCLWRGFIKGLLAGK